MLTSKSPPTTEVNWNALENAVHNVVSTQHNSRWEPDYSSSSDKETSDRSESEGKRETQKCNMSKLVQPRRTKRNSN